MNTSNELNTYQIFNVLDKMNETLQSVTAGNVENDYLISLLDPFNKSAKVPPVTLVPTVGKKIDISHAITVTADMKEIMLYWVPHCDRPNSQLQIGIRHTNDKIYWAAPPSWSENIATNYTQYRLVSSGILSRSNALSTGQFFLTGSANATIAEDHPDVYSLDYSNIYGFKRADASARMSVPASEGVVMLSRPVANITMRPFRANMNLATADNNFYPYGVNESSQSSYKYDLTSSAMPGIATTNPFSITLGVPDNRGLVINNGFSAFRIRVHLVAQNTTAGDCDIRFGCNTFNGGVYTDNQSIGGATIVPVIAKSFLADNVYVWDFECVWSAPRPLSKIDIIHQSAPIVFSSASYVVVEQIGEEEDGLLYPGYFTIWKGLGVGQDILISGSANYELIANPEISKQVKASLPTSSSSDLYTALGFLRMLMHAGVDGILNYNDYRELIKSTRHMMKREQLVPYGVAAPFSFLKPLVPYAVDIAANGLKSMMKSTCDKMKDAGWAQPYKTIPPSYPIDVPSIGDLVTEWESNGPVSFHNGLFDGNYETKHTGKFLDHRRMVLRDEITGHIVLRLETPVMLHDPMDLVGTDEFEKVWLYGHGKIYQDTTNNIAVYYLDPEFENEYLGVLSQLNTMLEDEKGYAMSGRGGSIFNVFRNIKVKPSAHVVSEVVNRGPRSNLYDYVDYVKKTDQFYGQKKDAITRKKRPEASLPGFMQYPYINKDMVMYGLLAFTPIEVDYYPEASGKKDARVEYVKSVVSKVFAEGNLNVFCDTTMDADSRAAVVEAVRLVNSSSIDTVYVTNISELEIKGPSLQGAALYWALGGFNFVTISAQFDRYDPLDENYALGINLVPVGAVGQKAAIGRDTSIVLSVPKTLKELGETIENIMSHQIQEQDIVLPGQMILGSIERSKVYLATNYFDLVEAADVIGGNKLHKALVDVISPVQMQPLIERAKVKSGTGNRNPLEIDQFNDTFAPHYANIYPQFLTVYPFRNDVGNRRTQYDQMVAGYLKNNPPVKIMDTIPSAILAKPIPVVEFAEAVETNADKFSAETVDQASLLLGDYLITDDFGEQYVPRKEAAILWNKVAADTGGVNLMKTLLPDYFVGRGKVRSTSVQPRIRPSPSVERRVTVRGREREDNNPKPSGGGGFGNVKNPSDFV